MSKSASRDVKKRLYEFAKNEYEQKSPEYVEVRRAKGTKTFYRGPVPQLILTRYKAIRYTVFADYGTLGRMYYFNKDGYCVRDTTHSEKELERIKAHLEKTTTRVLRYPRIEPRPTIANLSVELDNRFAKMITEIEKTIKKKIESRPVVTLRQQPFSEAEDWFISLRPRGEFLEVPVGIEKDQRVEILLAREAFFVPISRIISNNDLAFDFSMIGALLLVDDQNLRKEALKAWSRISWDKTLLKKDERARRKEIELLFAIIDDINYFLNEEQLLGKEGENGLSKRLQLVEILYSELFNDSDSKERLAKFLQQQAEEKIMKKEQEAASEYLLHCICVEFLSKSLKNVTPSSLSMAKKIGKSKPKGAVVTDLIMDLSELKVSSFLREWRANRDLFSLKIDQIIDQVYDKAFARVIELEFVCTTTEFDKPGDLEFTFKNNSDASLGTFLIDELSWTPRDALELIGERRRMKLQVLIPGEKATFRVPVIPKKKGTINFKSLGIRFNDPSGIKHFVRLPVPSIVIQ